MEPSASGVGLAATTLMSFLRSGLEQGASLSVLRWSLSVTSQRVG